MLQKRSYETLSKDHIYKIENLFIKKTKKKSSYVELRVIISNANIILNKSLIVLVRNLMRFAVISIDHTTMGSCKTL